MEASTGAPGAPTADLNPLVEGLERLPVHPTTLVVFGATGDLAQHKILPALYNLAHDGALPEHFNLVGVSLDGMSEADYREQAGKWITAFSRTPPDRDVLAEFLAATRYVAGTFDDDGLFKRIGAVAQEIDDATGMPLNRTFYLAVGPAFFKPVVDQLGRQGLNERAGAEVRVVIEKPFGTRLLEARQLNRDVLDVLYEEQVFRIDHYLGKETVQNLLALRFANGLFEPIWNRNYIDSVQITAAEDVGIGHRASYYDRSGALRDLVQNHLLQLLTLLCMEPPVAFSADEVRTEKVKVLHSIHPPTPAEVSSMAVRAQYTAGASAGDAAVAYLDEPGVTPDSTTESYAALRLEVDNWRWAGVPFYLRTGKRLTRKITEISVILKPVPHVAFHDQGSAGVQPNELVLAIQPNEGVSISIGAKIPGSRMRIRPVKMEFLYGSAFMSASPEAYERLILDAMRGDATLFTRDDEVEAQWRICDPILEAWSTTPGPLANYTAGSDGPAEANALLAPGHHWRPL
jgi:glucose-6-phosphate 1-dehydrogenase